MIHTKRFPTAMPAGSELHLQCNSFRRFMMGDSRAPRSLAMAACKTHYPAGNELVGQVWNAHIKSLSAKASTGGSIFSPLKWLSRTSSQLATQGRNMVEKIRHTVFPFLLAPLVLSMAVHAEPAAKNDDTHSVMTLSTQGDCEFSTDGTNFAKLEKGHTLEQGAVIRTGEGARTDLFLKRTGTIVRLQAGTEIKLEIMSITMENGLPLVHTLLDLRTGRIFTVVRHAVAGSTMEIKNKDGRAVVEGSGIGRYIITADGTHVAAERSGIPLKVIGETGITILSAGQQFSKADGKMIPLNSSVWVKELIQMDELEAVMGTPVAAEAPPKP